MASVTFKLEGEIEEDQSPRPKAISKSALRYRQRREKETGIAWDEQVHTRGRKQKEGGEVSYHTKRYRAASLAFKEHIATCRRTNCQICDSKPRH